MGEEVGSLVGRVEEVSNRAFAFVPLPWRVLFLIGAAILGWATNMHFLNLLGIDTAHALGMHSYLSYSHLEASSGTGHLFSALYKLFAAYAAWSFGCWLFFRAMCSGNAENMDNYKIIPQLCIMGILIILICPFNIVRKRERDLFLSGLHRCLLSPLRQPIYFSDVVLADILTSLAKVFGDVWVSVSMLSPGGSLREFPMNEGWSRWISPFMMSFPYLVRFRQCMVEFLSSPCYSDKKAFFNAIKYLSAFPVIFLSAAQRLVKTEIVTENEATGTHWRGQHPLFKLWLLAVALNSGYSFWWDVTNDWGLSLLSLEKSSSLKHIFRSPISLQPSGLPISPPWTPRLDEGFPPGASHSLSSPRYPRGLRPKLLFNDTTVYYIAIGLNFILRLLWSLKLSSHLHTLTDLESGIFLMEALEIIRRWIWVFFRIEWEIVKKTSLVYANDQSELVELSGEDDIS